MGSRPRLSLKARFYLAVAFASLLVGLGEAWLTNRALIRCATIHWREFDEVSPGVFVGRGASAQVKQEMLDALRQSDATLTAFFGQPSRPGTVILCPDAASYRALTGEQHGSALTLRTPFGDYVVARASTRLPLLLAHERTHSIIDDRAGWWAAETKLPMWFVEGIAIVASGDTRFDADRIREAAKHAGHLPSLDELESMRQFQRLAAKDPALAYGPAAMEVSLWYRAAGREGLDHLLDGLRQGRSFPVLYRQAEQRFEPPVKASHK